MKHENLNDHLAQERTLLSADRTFSAWIRTALTGMACGIAILRLITFRTEFHRDIAHIIGETLILWGIILIILSSIDYKKTKDKLNIVESYKSSQLGILIIVIPLLIMAALLIWVTLP